MLVSGQGPEPSPLPYLLGCGEVVRGNVVCGGSSPVPRQVCSMSGDAEAEVAGVVCASPFARLLYLLLKLRKPKAYRRRFFPFPGFSTWLDLHAAGLHSYEAVGWLELESVAFLDCLDARNQQESPSVCDV